MTDTRMTAGRAGQKLRGVTRALAYTLLGAMMLAGTTALAQLTSRGQVLGNVTDTSGGRVAGATVKLISLEHGDVSTTQTNSRGEYLFGSVSVGSYKLEVSKDGYSTDMEEGINVDADQNVRVDPTLAPASAAGVTVEVQANANTVDTTSATIGVLIDDKMVHDLPVEGGNVVQLAALLPGVSNVSAPTTFTDDQQGPTYNVSGSRSTQNLFLLDGSLWNNLYNNSGLNFPPPEAIQEISVLLNNFQAQYGRNTGSVFNAITKSGTNTLHGSAYDYFQNKALNANDYFLKQNPIFAASPPKDVFNLFGATAGGPIQRDKLFYFAAYQGLRFYSTNIQQGSYGFTDADRGLLSDGVTPQPCNSNGWMTLVGATNCVNLFDLSGTAYLNLTTNPPTNATGYSYGEFINPLSSSVTTSAPGQTSTMNTLDMAYTQAGYTIPTGSHSPCVLMLYNLLNLNITGTNGQSSKYINNELPIQCINPVIGGPGGYANATGVNGGMIGTYMPLPNFSASTVNPLLPLTSTSAPWPQTSDLGLFRVDYDLARHQIDARYYQAQTKAAITANTSGVANYEIDNQYSITHFGDIGDRWTVRPTMLNELRLAYKRYFFSYLPSDTTQISSFGSNFPNYNTHAGLPVLPYMGAAAQQLYYTVNEDIEAVDNLSWMKGNHNYLFGADMFRLQYQNITESAPVFSFGSGYTGAQQGDELLGLLSGVTVANSLNRSGIQHDYYFYAQDSWRAAPRLTLSMGIRYELPLRYYQPDNQNTTFIPGYQSSIFANAVPDLAFVGDPGVPRALIKNEYGDIAPRFGLAYDMTGKGRSVFRTGGGIFYEATNALTIGVGEPYHYQATYAYPTGGISNPLYGEPAVVPNWNGKNPQFTLPFSIFYPDKNYRGAYTLAYNIGFQQSIMQHGKLEMNYVLRLGRHQALPMDRNPAIFDCSGPYHAINPNLYCPSTGQATNPSYQARVVYPGFNYGGQGVVDYMSIGTSNYNGFQVHYTQSAAHKLTVQATFSYAKSMDEFSNGTTTTNSEPQVLPGEYVGPVANGTQFNSQFAPYATGTGLSSQYGPSDYDVKLSTGIAWTLAPVKFTHGNGVVRAIFSGWTQGGYYNAQTGQPFSLTQSFDGAFSGEPLQRLMLHPSNGSTGTLPGNRHRTQKINAWFDNSLPTNTNPHQVAWNCIGSTYCQPNSGDARYAADVNGGFYSPQKRNDLRGPAYITLNVNAGRVFTLHTLSRTSKLTVRMEAVNVLNEPNLAKPGANYSSNSSNFGVITSTTGPNNNTRGNNARRIQLYAKYNF